MTKAEALAGFLAAEAEARKARLEFLRADRRTESAKAIREFARAASTLLEDARYAAAKALIESVDGPGWVGSTLIEARRIARIEAGEEAKVIQLHTERRKGNPWMK
jgi:hypothetical protein